jgi:general secretion pathway protein L
MPTWLGIDIGSTSVKVAVVRATYRKLALVRLASAEVAKTTDGSGASMAVSSAVALALEGEKQGPDAIGVAIEGSRAAIHRLSLPATAQKQLADVLAYELEAQIPFDIAGAVFDWKLLEKTAEDGQLSVVAAVARVEDVRARVDLVKSAIVQEPERVGVGAFVLGALAPHVAALTEGESIAVVDLGAKASEVLILERGEPVFARTLSVGTEGLPATAERLARDLRVSFAAHRAQGGAAPASVILCGGGAFVSGAEVFLSTSLEMPVKVLPEPAIDMAAVGPDAGRELPRYAKALALALSLGGRGAGLNLRRGPLAFERGFAWVRERIPVLVGLASVILVSFVFSAWSRLHAANVDRDTLQTALGAVTKEVLGTQMTTASDAQDLLAKETALNDEDPLPHADAFDVMVGLSKAVPMSMTHDIDELDVQKGHVTIRGIVGSIPDAQAIASSLGSTPCFSDVKIKSTTQAVASDRQKYVIELDLKCPEDQKPSAKKKADSASSASAAASGSPGSSGGK